MLEGRDEARETSSGGNHRTSSERGYYQMPTLGAASRLEDEPTLRLDHASAVSNGGRLSVRSVESVDALKGIETEWRSLEAISPASAVFQTYAHCAIWAKHFMDGAAKRRRLCITVVSDGGRPVMIVPLMLSKIAGLTVARIVGAPIAQYNEILADPQADLEACFSAVIQQLKLKAVDVIMLERVREDSLLRWAAAGRTQAINNARVAPFVDFATSPGHEKYLKTRSKNLTKSLRNRRNQIDKVGRVEFDTMPSGAEARATLSIALDLKREWLAERGTMSNAFADPATNSCLLDLAEHAPDAVVMRMMVDDELAAIRLGFVHGGTFFSYLSSYSPRFAQYSPGKLHMDYSIRKVREMGLKYMDMLPPAGEHKDIWCDTSAGVSDYAVALNWRGATYAFLYKRLRPFAKAVWLRLPGFLRTALVVNFLAL
jgi:CelD/BcsL family acetyltransferase involved in cellulose biosynthesis